MAPSSKSSSSKSSSSKKPLKQGSDSDDERPPSARKGSSKPSSSSKTPQKTEAKTSLLKSMFAKDKSEYSLSSKRFKDESHSSKHEKSEKLESAMFRDESRAPKVKSEIAKSDFKKGSEKYQSEKKKDVKRGKKIVEEEEFEEQPDFSDFRSKYEAPVKEKKVEKNSEKKPEKKVEKNKKPIAPKKHESVKVESKAFKSSPNFKTTFKDTHDIEMAEKQTMITELKGEELEEQEKWAFEKLKAHAGTCPAGFNWKRYTVEACGEQVRLEGYRCKGGAHFVTHEMVAKGEGGVMTETIEYANWDHCRCSPPFMGVRWDFLENILARAMAPTAGHSHQSAAGSTGGLLGSSSGGGGGSGNNPFGNHSQNLIQLQGGLASRLNPLLQQQPGGYGGFSGFGGFGGQQQQPGGGPSGFRGFGGMGGNGGNIFGGGGNGGGNGSRWT